MRLSSEKAHNISEHIGYYAYLRFDFFRDEHYILV